MVAREGSDMIRCVYFRNLILVCLSYIHSVPHNLSVFFFWFKRNLQIVFDYPSEVLTHVRGTYGPLMYMGPNVIKSLTFHTNRGKHGPFGEEQGPSFTHKIDEGKVVGFLGREGLFLDSIGVHVVECKISSLKPSSPYNAIVPHNNSGVTQIENSPWANKLVLAANGHGRGEEVTCKPSDLYILVFQGFRS